MKVKLVVSQTSKFTELEEARRFLKDLVEAGLIFLHSTMVDNRYNITIEQTTYKNTIKEGRELSKKYLDAGIVFVKLEKDDD